MTTHSRRKGASGEREVVALARSHGLEASRTWETAQHADPAVRCCDVLVAGRPCQVKRCARGHKALYDALAGVEVLFLRDDGREWLAVLPAVALLDLIRDANQHCREIPSVRQDLPSSIRREPAASGQEHSSPRRTRTGQFKSAPRSRISRAAVRLGRRSAEVRGLDRMQSDYDERGLAVYQFKSKSGEPPAEDSQPELAPTLSAREMPVVQTPPAAPAEKPSADEAELERRRVAYMQSIAGSLHIRR